MDVFTCRGFGAHWILVGKVWGLRALSGGDCSLVTRLLNHLANEEQVHLLSHSLPTCKKVQYKVKAIRKTCHMENMSHEGSDHIFMLLFRSPISPERVIVHVCIKRGC